MTLIRGQDTPVTVWHQDNSLQANISPNQSLPGTPEVGVVFLAPTSGAVMVIYGGQIRDSGGTHQVHIQASLALSTGETTPGVGGVERSFGSSSPETQFMAGSQVMFVGGLMPGREYRARLRMFATNDLGPGASTADIAVREIIVVPLP